MERLLGEQREREPRVRVADRRDPLVGKAQRARDGAQQLDRGLGQPSQQRVVTVREAALAEPAGQVVRVDVSLV